MLLLLPMEDRFWCRLGYNIGLVTTPLFARRQTGIRRLHKKEGVGWVSTFPVCRVNNALGREGVLMLMMRDDRYTVARMAASTGACPTSPITLAMVTLDVGYAGQFYSNIPRTPPYKVPVVAAVEVTFEEVAPGQLIHEWRVVA